MKKKYIQPVVTRVKLDPEQAILQACAVAAIFMNATQACVSGNDTMGIGFDCRTMVRGAHRTAFTTYTRIQSNLAPS